MNAKHDNGDSQEMQHHKNESKYTESIDLSKIWIPFIGLQNIESPVNTWDRETGRQVT